MISYFLITNHDKSFSLLPVITFQLWCYSVLIVSFIYLIRAQLRQSTKLWCRRTSLFVCAYFEKFDIACFKKSASCFKPINSWLKNTCLKVRKNSLESSKFLLSIRKFFLWLFQVKGFLVSNINLYFNVYVSKISLGRFLVSKKWQTNKTLLERTNLLLVFWVFFLKKELHFLLCRYITSIW